jgi:methionine-gamma-lyase
LNPVALGADIVVHSMTKFISGMSDVIAGAVCGSDEFIESLMDLHIGPLMLLGPTMDPKVASKISLRIPHLSIRMAAHGERSLALAERLYDSGVKVCYPGLEHHPDRALFDELRCPDHGYGGVLTIDMGDQETANKLMALLQNKYRFGFMAVSLGYFDTLMSCSGSSTSSELTDEDKSAAGISPGLLRMSVGYTGTLRSSSAGSS